MYNDTATSEIYTLSLHDALPISAAVRWALQQPLELSELGLQAEESLRPEARRYGRVDGLGIGGHVLDQGAAGPRNRDFAAAEVAVILLALDQPPLVQVPQDTRQAGAEQQGG